MDLKQLEMTIRCLYEGTRGSQDVRLPDQIEFHDPVVIVRGANGVRRMFKKLNRLFPASVVHEFSLISGQSDQFSLCVHYRRHHASTPTIFRSVLQVERTDGEISKLVEHWTHPIRRPGNSTRFGSRWLRGRIGRLLS